MQYATGAAVIAVALTFSGCSVDHPGVDSNGPPSPATGAVMATDEGDTRPASARTVPTAQPTPAMAVIALSGDGLDFVDPVSGSARHVLFDTDTETVVAMLTRVKGERPEQAVNGECGAGPVQFATWDDGLSVLSQEDKFLGWSMNARPSLAGADRPPLTTMGGIGLGSPRSALEAVSVTRVTPTSLGTEFSTGSLYGLLESPESDAPVTAMWAGLSCVFR